MIASTNYNLVNYLDRNAIKDILFLYLDNWALCNSLPGLRTLIVQGTSTIVDLRYGDMLNKDKSLRVGSISKVLISYIFLSIVDDGYLKLDDIVSDHIKGLKNTVVGEIKLFKLLNHSSGLSRDGNWQSTFSGDYPSDDEMYKYFRNVQKLRNCDWAYSNLGFELIRMILETVTKLKYNELVFKYTRSILTNPTFGSDLNLYNGYSGYDYFKRSRSIVKDGDFKGMYSSLSLESPIQDISKLIRDYVRKFGGIISKSSFNVDRSPEPNWELGISSWIDSENRKIYDHQGEVWGYTSKSTFIPNLDISISTFINCSVVPIHQLHLNLIETILLYESVEPSKFGYSVNKYKSRQLNLIALRCKEHVVFLRESLSHQFNNPIIATRTNSNEYEVVHGAQTSLFGELVYFVNGGRKCQIGPYIFERIDK